VHVAGEDRPVVVHGVQHVFHPPTRLPRWPDSDRRTRLVFITRNIEQAPLERALEAFAAAEGDQTS
jgi:G3E family GTPase